MSEAAQSYKSHAKLVPLFHFVLLPILLVNFLMAAYQLWRGPGLAAAWSLVMAFAFIAVALFARGFALKAQDRVIRLEGRLRMRELLPPDLHGRIHEFTAEQLIGLRFASDAELPGLAAMVLRDRIEKRDAIKKAVTNWRADHHRV